MTITIPLHSMIHRLRNLTLQEELESSPQPHFKLLHMIDQVRFAVETLTETVLRLITRYG